MMQAQTDKRRTRKLRSNKMRFFALIILFCIAPMAFSANIELASSIGTIESDQSMFMSESAAILLMLIGAALVFLDDHLKKNKNQKK